MDVFFTIWHHATGSHFSTRWYSSHKGMLTRYKGMVEEQDFPKSSASPGLSGTFQWVPKWQWQHYKYMQEWLFKYNWARLVTVGVMLILLTNQLLWFLGIPPEYWFQWHCVHIGRKTFDKSHSQNLFLVTIKTRISRTGENKWEKAVHTFKISPELFMLMKQ